MKSIRIAGVALIASLGLLNPSVFAACKTDACRTAVSWKHGFTAVVLQEQLPPAGYERVLTAIRKAGGFVAIEADNVLLGWFPNGTPGKAAGALGIRKITRGPVDPAFGSTADSEAAIGFFNRVVSGEYEDRVEQGLAVTGHPLVGCVQDSTHRLHTDSGTAPLKTKLSEDLRFEVEPTFWARQPWQNPQMRGRIRVNFFKVESAGGIDPNLYTWSFSHVLQADDQVYGAFSFWANEAAARSVVLSFSIKRYSWGGLHRWQNWVSVPYEPIIRAGADDYLWMNSILTQLGYPASPVTPENVYIKNDSFNAASKSGATPPFDSAFSVYLVYNPDGAPTHVADGRRGYAFVDGPHTTVMWDSGGWGPTNLGYVLTHETGHIFWACDEYYDPNTNTGCFTCNECRSYGPRPTVRNGNCDYTNASGSCLNPRVACLMKAQDYVLCAHTPPQIGW